MSDLSHVPTIGTLSFNYLDKKRQAELCLCRGVDVAKSGRFRYHMSAVPIQANFYTECTNCCKDERCKKIKKKFHGTNRLGFLLIKIIEYYLN